MSSDQQNPAPGRGKPTVAAAIFVVAFVLSASLMLWSGWQLYHGEQLPVAVTATGQACDWVVLIDAPNELAAAWDALATRAPGLLPNEVTATLADAAPWVQAISKQGVVNGQPDVICGWGRDAVLTMPHQQAKAWSEWLATRQGDPRVTALAATPGLLRLAVASTSHDTGGLLQRAAPATANAHLGTDLAYRAAIERTGGGAAHLFLPQATAARLLHAWLGESWLAEGIPTVQWLGLGLRRDTDRLRLHAHLGIDQHGAIWLKGVADVAALDDATGWIAANAQAAAIVRMPAELRHKVAGHYGPPSALLTQALAQTGTNKAQTLVWQRANQGGESVIWTADVPALPDLPSALVHGWRVVATTPAVLAQTQAVLEGAQPDQGKTADRDRQRLLTTTQGWFDGALQVDWVWTDLGVAVEAAWHR